MGYRSLAECVRDLEATGQLVVIDQEVDPYLEVAAIQRRVYQAGGPGPALPAGQGNGLSAPGQPVRHARPGEIPVSRRARIGAPAGRAEGRPGRLAKNPWRYRGVPRTLWRLLPRRVRSGPILAHQTTIDRLPQIQCWPMDGGPFITLPQVYTEDPDRPGPGAIQPRDVPRPARGQSSTSRIARSACTTRSTAASACTMRRRSGAANRLRVNVFVGGPPALTVAAVMPLPEGLPELAFAGALGGRRVAMVAPDGCLPMPAEADFVISGSIDPQRAQARRAVRRPPRLLQPQARFSGAARRARLPSRAMPSGHSPRSAARLRRTRPSAP